MSAECRSIASRLSDQASYERTQAMRAIQNTAFGDPVETLKLVDLPEPASTGPDEVLIAMEYAPINGNDLAVITNRFAYSTPLPSTVGNERVGRVLQVGSNVSTVKARAAVGRGNGRLAIDGVSGSAAARLIEVLSQNGTLVSYAFTSGELVTPLKAVDLHLRGIVVRGIYIDLPEYLPYIMDAIKESAELMARGELDLPVAAVYPLADYQKAVAHAVRGGN